MNPTDSLPMRPCWVEVSPRDLEDNFRLLSALAAPHAELLAVVKANAYGHSLAVCGPAAVRAGARWLAVTNTQEAIEARQYCPEPRILTIGGAHAGEGRALLENRITTLAWEADQLAELDQAARALGLGPGEHAVHLEIDTGMSRQGAFPDQLSELLRWFKPGSPLKLEGVMTHLLAADEGDGRVNELQLARMSRALENITAAGIFPDWLSVGSSAALLAGLAEPIGQMAANHGMKAMLRPGLALYGVAPSFEPAFEGKEPNTLQAALAGLKPVLCWKAKIISTRQVPAGAVVGYNGTFVATEPMKLGLIQAGYADGLDRHLGNNFNLLVGGQRAPLVGRVSMDHVVLDLTGIEGAGKGDEVVILGAQGAESITAHDHARATGTIPWEVFTRIALRVPRKVV